MCICWYCASLIVGRIQTWLIQLNWQHGPLLPSPVACCPSSLSFQKPVLKVRGQKVRLRAYSIRAYPNPFTAWFSLLHSSQFSLQYLSCIVLEGQQLRIKCNVGNLDPSQYVCIVRCNEGAWEILLYSSLLFVAPLPRLWTPSGRPFCLGWHFGA